MSSLAIARRLGVTDKTVAKAVAWQRPGECIRLLERRLGIDCRGEEASAGCSFFIGVTPIVAGFVLKRACP